MDDSNRGIYSSNFGKMDGDTRPLGTTSDRNTPFPESPKAPSALGVQEGGEHYRIGNIQPIEFIHANNLGFCEGNVVKYVTRHLYKNGAEDLKKARHYIDLLLELEYGN